MPRSTFLVCHAFLTNIFALTTIHSSGAALTLLLYDHLIHLDDEVKLVWRQPPTILSAVVMSELYVREAGLAYMTASVFSLLATVIMTLLTYNQ